FQLNSCKDYLTSLGVTKDQETNCNADFIAFAIYTAIFYFITIIILISCAGQITSYVDCYKPYERPSYYANGGTSYNVNSGTSYNANSGISYNVNRETVSHVKKETSPSSYNVNRETVSHVKKETSSSSYNVNRETVSHVKKETSSYENENNHSLAQNVPADEASEFSDVPLNVPTHIMIPIEDFKVLLKSALSESIASKDEIS
ncbi:26393_t:CDS:2, partial [Gigaspora margarita]